MYTATSRNNKATIKEDVQCFALCAQTNFDILNCANFQCLHCLAMSHPFYRVWSGVAARTSSIGPQRSSQTLSLITFCTFLFSGKWHRATAANDVLAYEGGYVELRHPCPRCCRTYKHRSHMIRHYRYECGVPQRFECPYCKIHLRQRTHVWTHIRTLHPNQEMYCIDIATNAVLTRRDQKSEWAFELGLALWILAPLRIVYLPRVIGIGLKVKWTFLPLQRCHFQFLHSNRSSLYNFKFDNFWVLTLWK